ncbi:MAG: hypothetical protein IT508_12540, partial [Burkholderiaceae bacterium]|nr:hypothetical protein [Burkholderiaceae bacterium]
MTALAQQAAESPAHLDPVLVHQVCQEWQIGQQAASLQRCIVEAAYQDKLKAEQQRDAALAERDALKAEVTRLYDELGRVSEELGLPRSIGPAPGWLKQQMADLKEARQLLATRVEADRLSEANDEIAALKSALESAAVGLGQSRVDRIAELENEVKTLRVFANAALEHQRE